MKIRGAFERASGSPIENVALKAIFTEAAHLCQVRKEVLDYQKKSAVLLLLKRFRSQRQRVRTTHCRI